MSCTEYCLSGRVFCIVMGASRGFGQSIATQFASVCGPSSKLVLTGRDSSLLSTVKEEILRSTVNVTVDILILDQSQQGCEDTLRKHLKDSINAKDFDQAVIVHNSGSLGDISKRAKEFDNMAELKAYFDVNLCSMIALNGVFLKWCHLAENLNKTVIHITSLAALQPFKTWSLYCTGKAARNMYFCCLAQEEPSVRVLNYAPGPLDTDMQAKIRAECGEEDMRKSFIALQQEGKLIQPDESVKVLLKILKRNDFESGAHIDYYDEI